MIYDEPYEDVVSVYFAFKEDERIVPRSFASTAEEIAMGLTQAYFENLKNYNVDPMENILEEQEDF